MPGPKARARDLLEAQKLLEKAHLLVQIIDRKLDGFDMPNRGVSWQRIKMGQG
jgi:hypothetical protein